MDDAGSPGLLVQLMQVQLASTAAMDAGATRMRRRQSARRRRRQALSNSRISTREDKMTAPPGLDCTRATGVLENAVAGSLDGEDRRRGD